MILFTISEGLCDRVYSFFNCIDFWFISIHRITMICHLVFLFLYPLFASVSQVSYGALDSVSCCLIKGGWWIIWYFFLVCSLLHCLVRLCILVLLGLVFRGFPFNKISLTLSIPFSSCWPPNFGSFCIDIWNIIVFFDRLSFSWLASTALRVITSIGFGIQAGLPIRRNIVIHFSHPWWLCIRIIDRWSFTIGIIFGILHLFVRFALEWFLVAAIVDTSIGFLIDGFCGGAIAIGSWVFIPVECVFVVVRSWMGTLVLDH